MRAFILTFVAFFLFMPLSLLDARMLFSEIEKEVHSPYKDSIVPTYDVTIDGSRIPCPPVYKQEINLTSIEIIDKKEDTPEKEQAKDGERTGQKEEKLKAKTNSNKVIQVEVLPSSTVRYPEKLYTCSNLECEKRGNDSPFASTINPEPSKENGTSMDGNKQDMRSKTKEWFVIVKASSLLPDLENDKKRLQKLFKNIPADVHEKDSYYFLMLGPTSQDNIGIMMKILERNNYMDATTMIAR